MNRAIKCPGCGRPVEVDGAGFICWHTTGLPFRAICPSNGMHAGHLLAWLDESIAAERAAIRAEVERRIADANQASAEPSTHGFVERFVGRSFEVLRDWLDARSNGGAK